MSDTLDEQEAWEQAAFEREQHQEYEQKIATLQNDIKRKDELIASANQLIEKLQKENSLLVTANHAWSKLHQGQFVSPIEHETCPECEHGIPTRYLCPKCIEEIEDETCD